MEPSIAYIQKLEEHISKLEERLAESESFHEWRDKRNVNRRKYQYIIKCIYSIKNSSHGCLVPLMRSQALLILQEYKTNPAFVLQIEKIATIYNLCKKEGTNFITISFILASPRQGKEKILYSVNIDVK